MPHLQYCCSCILKLILFHVGSFRIGFPTNKQIHRLNRNAIVSLLDNNISKEKVEINWR